MITRRDLLKVAGAAAAAGAAPSARVDGAEAPLSLPNLDRNGTEHPDVSSGVADVQQAGSREPLLALTADEHDLLTAIVGRLIPADAGGPGAVEAGAVTYIDRALAGPLSGSREAYRRGLAALERYARSSRGGSFRELAPTDQDSLLIDVETGAATGSGAGFDGSSAVFFALLRAHTWQGTFGDPYYGGNRNFVGWDLIGYPGVRLAVTPDDQRLGQLPPRLRRSAYDNDQFHRA